MTAQDIDDALALLHEASIQLGYSGAVTDGHASGARVCVDAASKLLKGTITPADHRKIWDEAPVSLHQRLSSRWASVA